MTCRELIDLIDEALEGELPLRSRILFESHVRDCSRCRQYLQSYTRTVQIVREAFEEENGSTLDPIHEDLIETILVALGGRRPTHRPGSPRWRSRRWRRR